MRGTGRVSWGLALTLVAGGWVAEGRAQDPNEPIAGSVQSRQADLSTEGWERGRSVSTATEDVQALVGGRRGRSPWLAAVRAVFFVPRMVLRYALLKPIEGGIRLFQRWNQKIGFRIFLNSLFRSSFRPQIGFGYSTLATLADAPSLSFGFSYGGRNFQTYEAEGAIPFAGNGKLQLAARYRRQGDESFFGFGNTPTEDDRARYFADDIEVRLGARNDWSRKLRSELEVGWSRSQTRDTGDLGANEQTLSERFDPDEVPAFDTQQDYAVARLSTRVDLRGRHAGNAPELMLRTHADTWLAVGDSQFSTLLYGGELDIGVPLRPRRVLVGRILLEAAAPLSGGQIPFYLLPTIGVGDALRGYPAGRLRDRLMTVAGLEYRWGLSGSLDALLFVDTGRVFRDYQSLELVDWKWGAGAGFRLKSSRRPIASLQLAYSPEALEILLQSGVTLF